MNDLIVVPVGNAGVKEAWVHDSRTREQFEAVRDIVNQPGFEYSCGSMIFGSDVGSYRGPFVFIYVIDGECMFEDIYPDGSRDLLGSYEEV